MAHPGFFIVVLLVWFCYFFFSFLCCFAQKGRCRVHLNRCPFFFTIIFPLPSHKFPHKHPAAGSEQNSSKTPQNAFLPRSIAFFLAFLPSSLHSGCCNCEVLIPSIPFSQGDLGTSLLSLTLGGQSGSSPQPCIIWGLDAPKPPAPRFHAPQAPPAAHPRAISGMKSGP